MIQTLRIFFVEDDEDDRELLQDLFRQLCTCKSRWFANGSQLFESLEQASLTELPSLMVMDYRLPKYEGDALVKALKQDSRYASIPIIILSSYVSQQKKAHLLSLGASRVEAKPDTMAAYYDLIQHLVAFASPSTNDT